MTIKIINRVTLSPLGNHIKTDGRLSSYEIVLLLSAIIVSYCILYGPQVIVAHWVKVDHLPPHIASYIVYISLIPLSIAPLSYGYFLGNRDTNSLISRALLFLGIITITMSWVTDPIFMLVIRLLQGALLPIIMTAVMSRLSSAGPRRGRQLITYYLCATVIGGLTGRLMMGHLTEMWNDQIAWALWGTCLLSLSYLLKRHQGIDIPYNASYSSFTQLKNALYQPTVMYTLLCGATMFGVFSAALNLLPLRALEIHIEGGSAAVSHRYWGYLIGALVSLFARSLDQALGHRGRAPVLGMLVMTGGLYWGSLEVHYYPLFGMVLLLCTGLFMTHPLLTAHITQVSSQERGLMSGLYVSSYYLGGALCSYIFSVCYARYGWSMSLVSLASISILGSFFAYLALRKVNESSRVVAKG